MLNVKENGNSHALIEETDLNVTAKSVTASSYLPMIYVQTVGHVCVIQCSGYTKLAMTKGTTYRLQLGVKALQETPFQQDFAKLGNVRLKTSGELEFTPNADMAKGTALNFSIITMV